MGCRSDYMEPTMHEAENARVLALIEELKTGKLPKWFGDGSHSGVYSCTTQDILDQNTERLCSALKALPKTTIAKHSLELQIWWRDHQAADKKRLAESKKLLKDSKSKAALIERLTSAERKLLNLK